MTQESGGTTAEAQVEPLTPGKLLRRERERRALSVQQAAEDLHLDASMVEAIEADRFAALGAPVYAKGHLKKYAALLGLSPADVIQRYEALSDTPTVVDPIPTTVAAPAQRARPSLKRPLWIALVLVALAAAAWVYYVMSSGPQIPVPISQSVEPQPTEAESGGVAETAPETPNEAPATTTSAAPAEPARTAPTPAPVTQDVLTTPTGEQIRLRLEFNDSSWIEITDATGRRLMFDTGAPGRVRTLSGVPPIRVTLGVASAVDLQVNDRSVAVPRRAGRDSARFVIEADGAVR